jgi:hypothetical protein
MMHGEARQIDAMSKLAGAGVDGESFAKKVLNRAANSGGSPEPPGRLLMYLHTVYMEHSECLPTLLDPG